MQEGAQLALVARVEQEMPMIRHDAIRQNPYRHPLGRLGQETHKPRVVFIILEDTGTRIDPIEYVKNDPTGGNPCGARHPISLIPMTPTDQ